MATTPSMAPGTLANHRTPQRMAELAGGVALAPSTRAASSSMTCVSMSGLDAWSSSSQPPRMLNTTGGLVF